MSDFAEQLALRQVDDLSPQQVDDLLDMYSRKWWTETRSADDVRLMLANTSVIVGIEEAASNRLTAFARVVTDRVYHGSLLDVIVRDGLRGWALAMPS